MNENQNVLSNNIKYLRKKLGLNQEQLAKALAIKRSNIAAYEAKNVEPRLRTLLGMSELFDVDLSTFIQTKLNDETDIQKLKKPNTAAHNANNDLRLKTTINIDSFVDKSVKIKKILIGLKSFHQFRKQNRERNSFEKEKIFSDIDNFIMLMEHLLLDNENLIKFLTAQSQDHQT